MGVAIPHLIVDLGITAVAAQWLTTAFMLTMAVVIPISGFLLQRFTTRQVFIAAMSLFSLGTLIATARTGLPGAARRPRGAGIRHRDHDAAAHDDDHDDRAGARTRTHDGARQRRHLAGSRDRSDPRRVPPRHAQLALDLRHHPADRPGRARGRRALDPQPRRDDEGARSTSSRSSSRPSASAGSSSDSARSAGPPRTARPRRMPRHPLCRRSP